MSGGGGSLPIRISPDAHALGLATHLNMAPAPRPPARWLGRHPGNCRAVAPPAHHPFARWRGSVIASSPAPRRRRPRPPRRAEPIGRPGALRTDPSRPARRAVYAARDMLGVHDAHVRLLRRAPLLRFSSPSALAGPRRAARGGQASGLFPLRRFSAAGPRFRQATFRRRLRPRGFRIMLRARADSLRGCSVWRTFFTGDVPAESVARGVRPAPPGPSDRLRAPRVAVVTAGRRPVVCRAYVCPTDPSGCRR